MVVGERKQVETKWGIFEQEVIAEAKVELDERYSYRIQRLKVREIKGHPLAKGFGNERIDLVYEGAKKRPWALIPEEKLGELIGTGVKEGILKEAFWKGLMKVLPSNYLQQISDKMK